MSGTAGVPNSSSADVRPRVERLIPLVLMIAVLVAAILSITPWPVGGYEDAREEPVPRRLGSIPSHVVYEEVAQ